MESESESGITPCIIAPLPYKYDSEHDWADVMDEIIEKVAEYCGYSLIREGESGEDGDITYADLWSKIWLVLRLFSLVTCWTDGVNDLFLMQTRKQQTTVKQLCGCRRDCCNCDEDQIVVPLEYAPLYDAEDCMYVSGTISVVINGRVVKEEIPTEYLYEHTDPYTNKLYIMREDFPDLLLWNNRCCCLCRRHCTITLAYNAGYEILPDGLLPLICPLLTKIDSAKIGLADCAAAMTQVVGLLKRKKVGNVEYEWSDNDSDTAVTQALFTDLFDVAMLAELEAISRCDDAMSIEEMGDVV